MEDNADVLRFMNMQLSEDHDVYLAQDGAKGLELAIRELPDVMVTDYMMPGNGWPEFAQSIACRFEDPTHSGHYSDG